MTTITPAVLARLRAVDTPTICNVIELFEVRPRTAGYMDTRIRACFPDTPPIVGFAATATCRTAIEPRDGHDYHQGLAAQVARFAELSGPPIVVFQDLDSPPRAATFGEIMCTTYKAFGAVGLITNGPGRDLDQVHRLGFPVFTDGAIVSHGYIQVMQFHVPIHVGGIPIYPDDLLHADVNGVTTIPNNIAAEVADSCADFLAAEEVLLAAMRGGNVTIQLLQEANAEKNAQIAALAKRIRKV
ncbi:MAG: RraA family protein [Anaerolineae bacterium]